MTTFDFLASEFPEIHAEAAKAARAALPDPRTSCFYARRVVELSVKWAFAHDPSLTPPYDDSVNALLHDPAFKRLAGDQVFRFARDVQKRGNRAVHESAPMTQRDAIASISALFEFTYWFARTYNRGEKPSADLTFDPRALPVPQPSAAKTVAQLKELETALEESELARTRALTELADQARLETELAELRAQVAAAKQRAEKVPDTHDYTEAETRDYFIDLLLGEAGWALSDTRDREVPVSGMPDGKRGFVDYVLWGEDGKPLALVEAKRTRRDARAGQQQAKLYADCLEAQFGQRPVIFTTNGYEHWMWDDVSYPQRPVQGFYTRDELALLIQRRTSKHSLAETEINADIAGRHYQTQSLRRIGEHFEVDRQRKALLVMATGAGKTRTVIALADLLIRANWAKRVLFLADRTALVTQAVNAFKEHLPDSSPVNLVKERDDDGRVYVSTYPTMMNLINAPANGERRFGVGHFDLVVIDEAHRSVFKKYRAIFEYFDALLVGLTATPLDEIDRNTYRLFDLEPGVPTHAYELETAVGDGFLVPPRAISVPLKFQRQGIRYDDLSAEEQEEWDELDWDEDDPDPPDAVKAEAINKWLFNADTVDRVLEALMTSGVKVAGGDRLGKTIVFAKNQAHAKFIAQRFDINYPRDAGKFAAVITSEVEQNETLIEQFSMKDHDPHIAISVDMLDTGIDVPEVVNLVFFKAVRSKTKFWQMIGRGTRLCPDLFGPGVDKEYFQVFDYCENFEFFGQNPDAVAPAVGAGVSERRFLARLDLLAAVAEDGEQPALRASIAELLRIEVAAMNVDNFIVRPHRRLVERFREAAAWDEVGLDDLSALGASVAGLPTELPPETEEAKRFDLLMLGLQLRQLRAEPGFDELRDRIRAIAGLLEEYPSIPAIAQELELIGAVQTDDWWDGVTLPALESVRVRLRLLVQFIEKRKRKIVYTDFTDEMGEAVNVPFAGLAPVSDFERFRRKALAFLRSHSGELAVEKIRRNWPITPDDMTELQRILVSSGVGTPEDCEAARTAAGSFGLFIRSLVGLDREAAKEAFGEFLDASTYSASQIEFVNLIIDDLTEHGVIEARRFYESPFTDVSPLGPEGLFSAGEVDRLVAAAKTVRDQAAVA